MKRFFILLNTLHVLNDGLKASMIILLPFIAKDLHISFTQVGILGGSINFVAILVALPSAYLALKFGGVRTLIGAMVMYTLGYLLVSSAHNIWVVGACFIIAGVGYGLFHPISFALISKLAPESRRGKMLGDFNSLGDIGAIAIPALTTFVVIRIGWQMTFLNVGYLLLGLFIVFFIFGRTKLAINNGQVQSMPGEALRKNKKFAFVILTALLDSFVSSPIYVFLPFLLLYRGLNASFLGIASGAFFVGSFAGKRYIGRLVDTFGNTRVFIAAELTMALLLILISQISWLPMIFVLLFLLGSVTRGTSPATKTMIYEAAGDPQKAEKAFGLSEIFICFGSTIGPTLMGFVSDHFHVTTAFTIFSLFAIGATIPAVFFAKYIKRDTQIVELEPVIEYNS